MAKNTIHEGICVVKVYIHGWSCNKDDICLNDTLGMLALDADNNVFDGTFSRLGPRKPSRKMMLLTNDKRCEASSTKAILRHFSRYTILPASDGGRDRKSIESGSEL